MITRSILTLVAAVSVSLSAGAQAPFSSDAEQSSNMRCEGGFDPSKVRVCGFDAIRSANRMQGEKCMDEVKNTLCRKSMWKGLPLEDRIERIMRLAQKHSADFGIDYRAAPCIITRESVWFDPLIVAFLSCKITTTDQGLGQTVFTTFQDLVEHQGFKSKVPPFNKPPYTTDTKLLFDAMAMSVDLQIEVLFATLKLKLHTTEGNYKQAFAFYNGSATKEKYGTDVNNCFACMKERVPSSLAPAQAARTNVNGCLDYALPNPNVCPGTAVAKRFEKFENYCEFGPPPPTAPLPPGVSPTPNPPLNCAANSNTNSGLSTSKTTAPGYPPARPAGSAR